MKTNNELTINETGTTIYKTSKRSEAEALGCLHLTNYQARTRIITPHYLSLREQQPVPTRTPRHKSDNSHRLR